MTVDWRDRRSSTGKSQGRGRTRTGTTRHNTDAGLRVSAALRTNRGHEGKKGDPPRHALVHVVAYMLCCIVGYMANSSSRLVYDGAILRIEFYVAPNGVAPAEAWLE